MIDLDDDRLGEVLASMADLLVIETADASVTTIDARRRRSLRAIALAVAAAAVTVLSVAPLRGAVADWLGIGSTRVDIDPTPPTTTSPLPAIDEGLPLIDASAAEALLNKPLPELDSTTLGAPVALAAMPEGGVLVVWADRSTLWIHDSEMNPEMLFDKLVSAAADVERIDGLGDEAIAVTGDHMLHTPRRTLRATTTVLWKVGRWEYRLESDRAPADLIDLARSLD